MKTLLITVTALILGGCAWLPSFWDDNQSRDIITVRLDVESINCSQPQLPQVLKLKEDLRRFELYSQSKGTLQKDVLRVIEPIQSSVKEWLDRGEGSQTYCEIKKKIMAQQGERAAKVILGRW